MNENRHEQIHMAHKNNNRIHEIDAHSKLYFRKSGNDEQDDFQRGRKPFGYWHVICPGIIGEALGGFKKVVCIFNTFAQKQAYF